MVVTTDSDTSIVCLLAYVSQTSRFRALSDEELFFIRNNLKAVRHLLIPLFCMRVTGVGKIRVASASTRRRIRPVVVSRMVCVAQHLDSV